MEKLKNGLSALFVLTIPTLAGCSSSLPLTGSDRAIAMYRDSLGPRGAMSFRRNDAANRKDGSAANDAKSVPSSLTLEVALEMAKKNSVRLLALQAAAAAAEASVAAADRHRNPELRVTQFRLDDYLNGKPQVRTAMRFFPDRPGAVAADIAEARAKHAQALANAQAEEQLLEANVRWAFDDVVLLDAEIAATRTVSQTRQTLVKELEARVAAASSTALDETLAELSALDANADLGLQEARRREALGTLFDLLGITPEATVEIQGDPALAWPPPELPSEQTLVERALRRSPEVAVATAKLDATDARAYAERAKRFPWFSFLEVGYQFSPKTTEGLGWTFQGGMEVPIFDTNRNGVAASDAAKTAAQRAFEAEVERVARDVRARLRNVRLAAELVTQYRDRALATTEKAGKEAQRALEARNIDTIRALSVDEKRAVVQLRLLRLVRSYRTAMAELRRVSGSVNSAATP